MDWSHIKQFTWWLNKEMYETHRYYVPDALQGRIKFLRKYFRVMDRENIPKKYKRRKSSIEFAETALMILGRIDSLFQVGVSFVAGSCYLAEMPWATFGELPEIEAKLSFCDF